MTILIIKVTIQKDFDTGEPVSRSVDFIIDNNDLAWYKWSRGGLPLSGAIQSLLDAEAAQLYADAVANGRLATGEEITLGTAREVYRLNPGMKAAVFDKTMSQQFTDITTLVNSAFPTLSQPIRTALIQIFFSSVADTNYNARREGLVNGEG